MDDLWYTLTDREKQVAKLISMGYDNKYISSTLNINIKTYDTHRGHILKKLHLKNPVLLTRWMLRRDLVSLGEGDVA